MSETKLHKFIRDVWTGRTDGSNKDVLRWHQIVREFDFEKKKQVLKRKCICFSGYACDRGAVENNGRPGSANGPRELRKACASFPVHHDFLIYETGDIRVINDEVFSTQQLIGNRVTTILNEGVFPVIIGGDHSLAFGHYMGLSDFLDQTDTKRSLGIINFDAHFDMRRVDSNKNGHSGSSFYQVGMECSKRNIPFHYLPIGIQRNSNTANLYKIAESFGVQYISADEFNNDQSVSDLILQFLDKIDHLYLSIDLDVFAAAYAPGVSAPASKGIIPDYTFYRTLRTIVASRRLISLDLAELNPAFDEQGKTAKLGAAILFEIVSNLFT